MSAKTILALDTKTGDQATVHTPPEHLPWLAVDFIKERLADPYRCSGGPQDRVFLDYLLALVESLTAERDALAAQVARVESLAGQWERLADTAINPDSREWLQACAATLRECLSGWPKMSAALAGSEADTTDTQSTDQDATGADQ